MQFRRRKDRSGSKVETPDNGSSPTNQDKALPLCLYGPHRSKEYRYRFRYCKACLEDDKKALRKGRAFDRAIFGPEISACSQSAAAALAGVEAAVGESKGRVTGRVNLHPLVSKLSLSSPLHRRFQSLCLMARNQLPLVDFLTAGATKTSSVASWP